MLWYMIIRIKFLETYEILFILASKMTNDTE